MRTDVKVGVALLAVILIIAVSYYGTKKRPDDVQLADAADKVRDQNAKTLDGMLSSNRSATDDKNKKPGEAARPAGPAQQRPRTRPLNGGAPSSTPNPPAAGQAARTNPIKTPVRPAQTNPESPASTGLVNKPSTDSPGPTLDQSSVLPARPAMPGATGPGAPGPASVPPDNIGQISPSPGAPRDGLATSTPGPGPGPASASPAQPLTAAPAPTGNSTATLDPSALGAPGLPPLRTQTPGSATATNPPPTPAAAAPRTHVIASGDTFAKLAERYYGSQKHARVLVSANPTVDPKTMKIGATITIPPLAEAAKSSAKPAAPLKPGPGQHEYAVQEGDTLYTIAEKHLGSGGRWPEIYELNKQDVGNDPMTLRVGHVILLPSR